VRFIRPMLAATEEQLPREGKWSMEVKLDGIRAIAIKNGAQTRLFSRRPRDISADYPEIAHAIAGLPARQLMVDGEIAALDEKGRSSFQLLQNAKRDPAARDRVFYFMFDLMHVDGRDTTSLPLAQRRKMLRRLAPPGVSLKLSASLDGSFQRVWNLVRKLGLEGIIAKREDSKYEAGRRSGAWIKIKARHEQEFVIGGYTPPKGHREYFGSILAGYYAGKQLFYSGRVGTGFDAAALASLYGRFQKIRAAACPFSNLPTKGRIHSGQGVTAAEMKRYAWLRPRLVCQVKFLEWTRDGNLRQPVFLGLREDKRPPDVARET